MVYQFNDLERLIDEQKRVLFVNQVFDGDVDAYRSFVGSLANCNTWKAAYQYMIHEFQELHVNLLENSAATELSDIVFKKYNPLL